MKEGRREESDKDIRRYSDADSQPNYTANFIDDESSLAFLKQALVPVSAQQTSSITSTVCWGGSVVLDYIEMGHPHANHMLPMAQLSELTVPYPVLWNFVHIGSSCSGVSTMILIGCQKRWGEVRKRRRRRMSLKNPNIKLTQLQIAGSA